ncbi:serine/threonine-protein phosphatase [Candidatus Gracilibacteria bacterium]|nr:serine/threonine-protein phosphatase [Candidatus Gracilibacteria bacterium]
MKHFFFIFGLLLTLVFALHSGAMVLFGSLFLEQTHIIQVLISGTIVGVQVVFVLILVHVFFHDPILVLERHIQEFLIGKKDDKKIGFQRGINSHLNFILKFFEQTLGTLKHIKSEFLHGKEIKSEVDLGKEIQGKMLEKKLPSIPSLDIIIKSKPAGEIGGDSYDIIPQEDNYYIYVGDATGHGVGAGFIMMMVNSLVSGFSKVFQNGSSILAKTNEILKPRVKANLLMTLLMLRWNEQEKRLFMTGAGHEYLMIYKYKQKKCFQIKSGGVALGMIKDISKMLKDQEIKFEANDIIVLYSDGITEAINTPQKNGNEQMFGESRLIEAIEKAPDIEKNGLKSAQSVFNNITIELSKFMGYHHAQLDDITLGVIHYTGEKGLQNDISSQIPEEMITEWHW